MLDRPLVRSGNLLVMPESSPFSDADRTSIVREYADAASRGETQRAFCARTGIAPRTLRSWLKRYSPPARVLEAAVLDDVRAELRRTVAQLQALLATLDAATAASVATDSSSPCRDVDEARTTGVVPPAPETGSGMETATTSSETKSRSISGFDWGHE